MAENSELLRFMLVAVEHERMLRQQARSDAHVRRVVAARDKVGDYDGLDPDRRAFVDHARSLPTEELGALRQRVCLSGLQYLDRVHAPLDDF